MEIDKQIIIDLYETIKSQNAVISYLVTTDQALINTLANDPALPNFSKDFQKNHTYTATNPKGQAIEAMLQLQRTLVAIGEKLKQDIGGWNN